MNPLKLQDLEYVAIRFEGGLSFNSYLELINNKIISSHRELSVSLLKSIINSINRKPISEKTLNTISNVLSKENKIKTAIEAYVNSINTNNIDVVSVLDDSYPKSWQALSGMPLVIFTKGDKSLLTKCYKNGSVAVVGSRAPSRYALYATKQFVADLALKDIVIVSGGAKGIDREAHLSAIENNGKTIAVSPCGLDLIYPYGNRDMYEKIYSNGLVISEMPPGQQALKQYFPARNRLISALSDVCLVMEAGLYSGTLHTASFSANYGRDVFVLPNNIYVENCHGGLKLIRDGAEVLIDSKEVIDRVANIVFERLKDYFYESNSCDNNRESALKELIYTSPDLVEPEDIKWLICEEVSERPKTIEDILVSIPIEFGRLLSLVSELEMCGKIENSAGKYFLTIS